MENEENKVVEQKQLTAEEQQQAYLSAMRELEEEKKKEKKKKRKKRLLIFFGLVGAFIIYCVVNLAVMAANSISETAINNDFSYIVNENSNTGREAYLEKIDNAVADYVGEKDIKSEKIQKHLYKQGKKALKEEEYLGAVQILNNCVEYEGASELLNEANYKAGLKFEKEGGYSYAATHFEKCGDYMDAKDRAKENHYQLVLKEIADGKEGIACLYVETNELFGYKETNKAYLWALVQSKCDNAKTAVSNAVKNSCKDPSSYRELSRKAFFYFNRNGKDSKTAKLNIEVTLRYSATNSYGGRVSDTYEYTTKAEKVNLRGFSYDEALRFVCLGRAEILSECGYVNK